MEPKVEKAIDDEDALGFEVTSPTLRTDDTLNQNTDGDSSTKIHSTPEISESEFGKSGNLTDKILETPKDEGSANVFDLDSDDGTDPLKTPAAKLPAD